MSKFRGVLKNFSFALGSNIVSFIISVLVTLLVPRYVSVEGYGYFQLYLFYTNYIGFLHFGWCDGLCLRHAGKDYEELDRSELSGQFLLYSILEVLIGVGVIGYSLSTTELAEKSGVLMLIGVAICLVLPKTMMHTVLYTANRIREYSVANMVEKITYIVCILLVIFTGIQSYTALIVADLLGKLSAALYVFVICKDIIFFAPCPLRKTLTEAKHNIGVGIHIMFATIASNLIVGIVRMAMSDVWSAEVFGKVSLTISVSNMLLLMVGAISLIMFPLLKRIDNNKLSAVYAVARSCLMIPILGMLLVYYPAKEILSVWLPQYADSLRYMALLFPICVFGSKMSMLVTTYMKALRKEKWLLFVNVATVCLSGVVTYMTVYKMKNLDLAVASIVILMAFRCVLAELLISGALEVDVKKDIVLELLLTVVFIISAWFVGKALGFAIYAVFYVGYLYMKRKDIVSLFQMGQRLLHS